MTVSERWLNPFWFPSETKVRFGLVLLAAGCLSLFAARRGLEILDYHFLAWIWLALVLFLPTIWRLASRSLHRLRRQLTLTPIEPVSPVLAKAVTALANDPWLDLNSPPQVWLTPYDISPISFGLGGHKHIFLPQFLLDHYRPSERGVSAELEAILRHELAHIKNGDLSLKELADVAFRAASETLVLWLLPLTFWSALWGGTGSVISAWEVLYLVLALLGSFYLYRTALRWRELYADVRVTLGMGTGKPLVQGLTTVDQVLAAVRHLEGALPDWVPSGIGLIATDVWWRIPDRWWPFAYRPVRLQALFRSHPTTAEREVALSNPDQLFQAADRGLVFLSGFLPVLVVGLFFGFLPKEALNEVLLTNLNYLWPELSRLVAEGQAEIDFLRGGISPLLATGISSTILMDSLQAAIRLPLALWVLTQVLVGPVVRNRGRSALEVSIWFVVGVLTAQTISLETLRLLLRPEESGYTAILLGYLQALIGTLTLAVMVFFYVFALRGLLRRYPSPPQFRRWLKWTSALFIGIVAWESLGAVPLGTTVEILPFIAAPKVVKWLLILTTVAWLGLTTWRRCPACHQRLTIKDEKDISSPHRCGRCDYPLYSGWAEARPGDVTKRQVAHWLKRASGSQKDETVTIGLRRIGRQAGLKVDSLREVIVQIAPAWANRLQTHRLPNIGRVIVRWVRAKIRGIWVELFPPRPIAESVRPRSLVVITILQGVIGVGMVFSCSANFLVPGIRALITLDKPEGLYIIEPEPSAIRLMGVGELLTGLFLLAMLGFLIHLLIRGTWERRSWAYAVNLTLAGFLCATIVLSIVGLPLLLYLRHPTTKRQFRIRQNIAIPLVPHLLSALYIMIGLVLIYTLVYWITQLLPLLDPATYARYHSDWFETYSRIGNFGLSAWVQSKNGILKSLTWGIAFFLLAHGAKHRQSWAYLIGIWLTIIASLNPILWLLTIPFLRLLLKPEVRWFYGIKWRRPLAVDLVSSFFLFVGFSNINSFIFVSTTAIIGGFLFPSVQNELLESPISATFFLSDVGAGSLGTLILGLASLFLAWGNLNSKRWAYIPTLGILLVQLLITIGGLVVIWNKLPLLITSAGILNWLDPTTWISLSFYVLSILVPLPAIVAMFRPQVRHYFFGSIAERPLIIELATTLYLAFGLIGLTLLSLVTISTATALTTGGWLLEGQFSAMTKDEIDLWASGILSFLNLGDFVVIPSFILAAAIWQGRPWAYRASLKVITLATASVVLTPIALPLMIALSRPAIQRLYLKQDKTEAHPLIDRIVFLHYLNLALWSIMAVVMLIFGIISVSSPTRAQGLIWPSETTTQEIFWSGVLQFYRLPLLIGAIALTAITVRGIKKRRPWAYLTGMGLATYGLIGIHSSIGLDLAAILINLIIAASALSLLITMMLHPVRHYFSSDLTRMPPATISWAVILWLLPFQWAIVAITGSAGVIIAQFTYRPGGEPLDSVTLFANYIAYAIFVALSLLAGVFGIGLARGLWSGQRWPYLFTLTMLGLVCLAIVPAVIALPLLVALWRPNSKAYFAGSKERPLVVEGLSLAYVGVVWLCLVIAVGSIPIGETRDVTLFSNLEFFLVTPMPWQTADIVRVGGGLGGALGSALLAIAIWRGRPWAQRVTIGLCVLGSLTIVGAPIGILMIIALLQRKTRRFFQADKRAKHFACPRCGKPASSGAYFCDNCGSKLGHTCLTCGTNLPVRAAFCPNCREEINKQ
jgi:Zn-dependent protease with chaperone function